MITVGELKEVLDDYGDHLPIAVVVYQGDKEFEMTDLELTDLTIRGDIHVGFEVEV